MEKQTVNIKQQWEILKLILEFVYKKSAKVILTSHTVLKLTSNATKSSY